MIKEFHMQEYKSMLNNYLNFDDRTSVRGYWIAVLFNFVIALALALIGAVIHFLSFLKVLYGLIIFIPMISMTVRRLKDTNRKWSYILLGLIPLVGPIILIIWLSQPTANFDGAQV